MPNVFANLKKDAKLARNAFDMSSYDIFTGKFGVLRPVFCMETLPNDHFEINPSNYLRTMQPLQTDAFVKASQNLDFYFVPFQQLFSAFPEFYSQVNDPQSYVDKDAASRSSVPYFSIPKLIYTAATLHNDVRLWGFATETQQPISVFDYVPAALYVYRSWFFGMIDLLDVLGYGNYLPVLDAYAQSIYGSQSPVTFNDIFEDVIKDIANHNYANFRQTFHLFSGHDSLTDVQQEMNVSVFRVVAYQRIWYNYYRNHYYDISNDAYMYIINLDWYTSEMLEVIDELSSSEVIQLFSIRYRQWKKDLLTGLLPSAQFGDVAVASINGDASVFGSNNLVNSFSFDEVYQDTDSSVKGNADDIGVSNFMARTSSVGVSVLQIRTAEALQRWKENTLRAGVKTTNQFKAHFGVEPRYVRDWYPDFLGSLDGAVNITTVTSQSETGQAGNGKLGDVAGNITSALSNKKIIFDAKDFGVIIGVYSILPDAQYNSFGIDEHNVHLAASDFYIPEFQNIGLAPVYARNVDVVSVDFSSSPSEVIGYAPRYIEYKYRQNKVHGLLHSRTRLYRVDVGGPSTEGDVYAQGDYNNWAIPRTFINQYIGVAQSTSFEHDINRFYVHPNVMDSVFYAADDGTPYSDQLIMAFNFDVKAVRPISVIGLPSF